MHFHANYVSASVFGDGESARDLTRVRCESDLADYRRHGGRPESALTCR